MAATAQLKARLSFDDSQFSRGLRAAQRNASAFASRLKSTLAGIGVATIIRNTNQEIDYLIRRSQALQIPASKLQQLAFAGKSYGVAFEDIAEGIHDVVERTEKAIDSNNEYRKAFEAIGINVQDFIGKRPEERFMMVAKAISESADSSRSLQVGMALASDEVVKILPMMRDYEGMTRKMSETPIVTDAQLAALRAQNALIGEMTQRMKSYVANVLGSVAGVWETLIFFREESEKGLSTTDAWESAVLRMHEKTERLKQSMTSLVDVQREYNDEQKKGANGAKEGLNAREQQIRENERALFSLLGDRTSLMTPEHRTRGASLYGPQRDLEKLARISNHLGGGIFAPSQGADMDAIRGAAGNPFDVISRSNGTFRFRGQGLTTGSLGDAPRRVGRSADLRELARERRDANRPSSEATAQKMLEKLGSIDRSIKEQSDTNF